MELSEENISHLEQVIWVEGNCFLHLVSWAAPSEVLFLQFQIEVDLFISPTEPCPSDY